MKKKPIIIKKDSLSVRQWKQVDWHLKEYGHLPNECGSKKPMFDCQWEEIE